VGERSRHRVDGLVKLDQQMQEIRATLPPETIKVNLAFVRSTDSASPSEAAVDGLRECRRCGWKPDANDRVSKCYSCGWRHGDDTQQRTTVRTIDAAAADEAVPATITAPAANPAPAAKSVPAIAKPERPYHETALKDSRPNAPASPGAGGSVCWLGTRGNNP
jgi:hypothetical protein